MNVRTLAIAFLLIAAPVGAQSAAPAPEAGSPPGTAAPQRVSTAPAHRAADDRPSNDDPRVCLEFPSREQVIACAERFRPRRGATKT